MCPLREPKNARGELIKRNDFKCYGYRFVELQDKVAVVVDRCHRCDVCVGAERERTDIQIIRVGYSLCDINAAYAVDELCPPPIADAPNSDFLSSEPDTREVDTVRGEAIGLRVDTLRIGAIDGSA